MYSQFLEIHIVFGNAKFVNSGTDGQLIGQIWKVNSPTVIDRSHLPPLSTVLHF